MHTCLERVTVHANMNSLCIGRSVGAAYICVYQWGWERWGQRHKACQTHLKMWAWLCKCIFISVSNTGLSEVWPRLVMMLCFETTISSTVGWEANEVNPKYKMCGKKWILFLFFSLSLPVWSGSLVCPLWPRGAAYSLGQWLLPADEAMPIALHGIRLLTPPRES